MIIVTGGAGMIGSNIVKALNNKGYSDILVVDNLKDGTKFVNLVDLEITDYMDKEDFIASVVAGDDFGDIEAVFHEGAAQADRADPENEQGRPHAYLRGYHTVSGEKAGVFRG